MTGNTNQVITLPGLLQEVGLLNTTVPEHIPINK